MSFYRSCAEKPQLLEHCSSYPKPVPSQTRSFLLFGTVFSLGFISSKLSPKLSSPRTHLFPERAVVSLSPPPPSIATLHHDPLPPLGFEQRGPPGSPVPGSRGRCPPHCVSWMPHPFVDLFFYLEFRALSAFLLCRKGQRLFTLPLPVKASIRKKPLPIDYRESSRQMSNVM